MIGGVKEIDDQQCRRIQITSELPKVSADTKDGGLIAPLIGRVRFGAIFIQIIWVEDQ